MINMALMGGDAELNDRSVYSHRGLVGDPYQSRYCAVGLAARIPNAAFARPLSADSIVTSPGISARHRSRSVKPRLGLRRKAITEVCVDAFHVLLVVIAVSVLALR